VALGDDTMRNWSSLSANNQSRENGKRTNLMSIYRMIEKGMFPGGAGEFVQPVTAATELVSAV
jgi:hypothetical protein